MAAAQAAVPCEPPLARIVSLQGRVEVQRGAAGAWTPAALDERLCVGDTIRVGALARAALALANDSVLSIDQLTTLRLDAPAETGRSLLGLLYGAVHFFSHRPRALEIDTPIASAGAEGTEFLMRVRPDRTEVVLFEGRVRLRTPAGELVLASGEAGVATPGAAPRTELVARPRDAVAWALYYPPVLAPLAERRAAPGAFPENLQTAIDRVAANDYAGAIAALDAVPDTARDARYHTYRAGVLLNVGRADEGAQAIERALALDPDAAGALAERAVIAVVQNRRADALADARRAVELAPDSAPARIALSYALQANFDLEAARQTLREAAAQTPENALVQARLAELELSFGDLDAAEAAAARAVALAPDLARTQMLLGFAALTRIDIEPARAAFERAIELDSAEPLARLGLGLAKIRGGHLEAGRRELEIAAALDPNNSLLRSYLGKAYFEEKRGPQDADQFQIAKQLDPNDPTPYFYDAIRKQSENRPVEALHDLETSIRLNDNRAVYRSRLLLDEDLAARGARLGRIYNDLGFQHMALVEGWRSVRTDPSNYSAHRLLADSYEVLPRHQIAQDSELLQAQLLQPININPVQPRLARDGLAFFNDTGPADATFAEFTRLFAANQTHFDLDGLIGDNHTLGDNAIVSGVYNRISYSLGQSHFQTDGVRSNLDADEEVYDAFLQAQLTPALGVQTEMRLLDEKNGDPVIRFDPMDVFRDERRDLDTGIARLGLRYKFSPASTTLLSYSYRHMTGHLSDGPAFRIDSEENVHSGELRHLLQLPLGTLDLGGGHVEGRTENLFTQAGVPEPLNADISHTNTYAYSSLNLRSDLGLTLGLSADWLKDLGVDQNQVNPKVGLIWEITDDTTLRAAAFRALKRTLTSSQTLEPTQIAGFNQFFDDLNGTDSWSYGIGVDRKLTPALYVGGELFRRELSVPEAFSGSAAVDETENFGSAYVYWAPLAQWALSVEYQYEGREREADGSNDEGMIDATTHKVPLAARFFHPSGWFAETVATFVDQNGRFVHLDGTPFADKNSFWTVDAGLGFRFPNRRGLVAIEIRNLFDEDFNFVPSDSREPEVSHERMLLARLTLQL